MEKLKPCPFCGGEPEVQQQGTARQSHIIGCTDCGCLLESNEVWNAGSSWNRRSFDISIVTLIEETLACISGMSHSDCLREIQKRLESK
jgi:Lar family restriction alleviation protein